MRETRGESARRPRVGSMPNALASPKKLPTDGCCGLKIDQPSQNHRQPPCFLAGGNPSAHLSNWSLDGDNMKNRKPLISNNLHQISPIFGRVIKATGSVRSTRLGFLPRDNEKERANRHPKSLELNLIAAYALEIIGLAPSCVEKDFFEERNRIPRHETSRILGQRMIGQFVVLKFPWDPHGNTPLPQESIPSHHHCLRHLHCFAP